MFHVSRVVGKLCVYIEDSGGDRREEWRPSVVETRIRSCVVKKKVGVFENCRKKLLSSVRQIRYCITHWPQFQFACTSSRIYVRTLPTLPFYRVISTRVRSITKERSLELPRNSNKVSCIVKLPT